MKLSIKIVLVALISSLCASCTEGAGSSKVSFDHSVYAPSYASGYEILGDDASNSLIRVSRPWQGDAVVEQSLAIFSDKASAEGYDGQYIVGRAERVVCMSTSHIAMIELLGRSESIVGVSGKQYIMSEAIAGNPKVKDVGYDSSLDYEALVVLRPDVVLLYGVSAENTALTAKLRELHLPYLYLGDYTEQSPLGKAEWLVAVAEIMGCRTQGEQMFSEIVERYNAVRDSVVRSANSPKVMFNTPYQEVWYMPSDDSYMVQLLEDAGGTYIYKGRNKTAGSVGISLEEAYMLVSKADLWLNVGQCSTLDELRQSAPHFARCAVVERGDVYNNNARRTVAGGSDFWESAIVRPDVVLEDMVNIVRGDDENLYYHHRLR